MTNKLVEFLEKTVDDEMILNSFIRNKLQVLKHDNDTFYVGLDDEYSINLVKEAYLDELTTGIKKIFHKDNVTINFVITSQFKKENTEVVTKSETSGIGTGLNKKQTFENFFEESFNTDAYFGARKIVEDFGRFNPLIIVSKSGLGKTHLLNATGAEFLKNNKNVILVNSNSFTEKFVNNVNKNLAKIKDNYKKYDVLIIDDFQMFENKPGTLTFLFEIFNDFIENDKQIVIGSEKIINKNLKGFPSRFITRLSNGVSLNISEPSQEDLKNLLISKLKEKGFETEKWSDEAIAFLVRNSDFNIRSIEGKINRIIFFKKDTNDLVFSFAKLKKIFNKMELDKDSINYSRIINVVANYYNFSKAQLLSKKREQSLVIARDIAIYFMRNLLAMTYSDIGKIFLNRNHSTIINSINKVQSLKIKDFAMNKALEIIETKIRKFE